MEKIIKFKIDENIDLHEHLCRAIHEKNLESLQILENTVSDIVELAPSKITWDYKGQNTLRLNFQIDIDDDSAIYDRVNNIITKLLGDHVEIDWRDNREVEIHNLTPEQKGIEGKLTLKLEEEISKERIFLVIDFDNSDDIAYYNLSGHTIKDAIIRDFEEDNLCTGITPDAFMDEEELEKDETGRYALTDEQKKYYIEKTLEYLEENYILILDITDPTEVTTVDH